MPELTADQKQVAIEWFKVHRDHVLRIIEGIRYAYPPTNSADCRDPKLWKAAHWVWFLHTAYPYLEAGTSNLQGGNYEL